MGATLTVDVVVALMKLIKRIPVVRIARHGDVIFPPLLIRPLKVRMVSQQMLNELLRSGALAVTI